MENKNQQKSSCSSLTSQLFGPTQESDVLASIFPPSKGVGQKYASSEMGRSWQKDQSGSGIQQSIYKQGNTVYKDRSSSYQQEGAEPSYLSSSLYYGGQEIYSSSTIHQQSPSSYPKFKKDEGDDDPKGAARGNWWQGSLYY